MVHSGLPRPLAHVPHINFRDKAINHPALQGLEKFRVAMTGHGWYGEGGLAGRVV